MMKRKRDGDREKPPWEGDEGAPLYTIGVASRLLDCDPSVLRRYERAGLVKPSRTDGNTRLYSRSDLDKLEEVHRLVAGEGLNSPGAQMVMELRDDIKRLETEVAALQAEVDSLKRQLELERTRPRTAVTARRGKAR
jgi:MerR family transcriptional regulator/heat shock protein HspR